MRIMLALSQELEILLIGDKTDFSLILDDAGDFSRKGGANKVAESLVKRYVHDRSLELLVLEVSELNTVEEWLLWVKTVEETKDIEGFLKLEDEYNQSWDWESDEQFPRILPLWLS